MRYKSHEYDKEGLEAKVELDYQEFCTGAKMDAEQASPGKFGLPYPPVRGPWSELAEQCVRRSVSSFLGDHPFADSDSLRVICNRAGNKYKARARAQALRGLEAALDAVADGAVFELLPMKGPPGSAKKCCMHHELGVEVERRMKLMKPMERRMRQQRAQAAADTDNA